MKDGKQGISADRVLMRIKDGLIILGALMAGFKFFYVKPLQMEDELARQREVLIIMNKSIENHTRTLEMIRIQVARMARDRD